MNMQDDDALLPGAFYKSVLDHLKDGVYFVDPSRTILFWNKGAEEISGYSAEEVVGSHCHDEILQHVDLSGNRLCKKGCFLKESLDDGQIRTSDIFLMHKSGHRIPVNVHIIPLKDNNGMVHGAVETFSTSGSRIHLVNRVQVLEQMALLDQLTGVGNRYFLEQKMETHLAEFTRNGWPFGIIMMDIDHFKEVNDNYGHNAGDATLRMVGDTLSSNLRGLDTLCRWGGEEFIAIIINANADQLHQMAERFRVLISTSECRYFRHKIKVTISAGTTLARKDDTIRTLIKRADDMLYKSKNDGRNRVTSYFDILDSNEPRKY